MNVKAHKITLDGFDIPTLHDVQIFKFGEGVSFSLGDNTIIMTAEEFGGFIHACIEVDACLSSDEPEETAH